MKNFLAGVLVVSVASIALSQAPPRPAGKPQGERFSIVPEKSDPKPADDAAKAAPWEYAVIYIPRGKNMGDEQVAQSLSGQLNEIAKDGWELFLIPRDTQYIFRKPVQQQPARQPMPPGSN